MYSLLRIILTLLFRIVFRCKVVGVENIPLHGGVIIASNHLSLWDPPFLGTFVPRKIHFMAKEELFAWPVLGWIITKLNAFPVRRGTADRAAIRTALTVLEAGKCLGLFPEGTRSKTGNLGSAELGLAMIAIKAGVPIVPTAVIGTNKAFGGGTILPKFELRFGNPIVVSKGKADKDALEKLTEAIMAEIARLLEK